MNVRDLASLGETYRRDGVVYVGNALDPAALKLAKDAFQWSLANPSPNAASLFGGSPATFYQDLCNPDAVPAYRTLLETTPVADIVAALWGSPDVWFMYEQVFLKEGGESRRTPWHQDSPYLAVTGEEIAVMWITFEPVAKEDSLEFVRGSHHGTLYNGSRFDAHDDTAPIYEKGLPRLPDIEAARDDWDIVSWKVEPGDVLVFHPAVLHGGAPTHEGGRRSTLSLRFFGNDACYAARPGQAGPRVDGLHESLLPGDPFRHPAFPKLRPSIRP
jgi:ectoine hydroxylase-related dioxygenase (phytanoyl-CoA dioxygenase family)